MKMLRRLRYLLAEGFEVGNISCYDAPAETEEPGYGRLTYVIIDDDGRRRLVSEEFDITATEAKHCSRLFMKSNTR